MSHGPATKAAARSGVGGLAVLLVILLTATLHQPILATAAVPAKPGVRPNFVVLFLDDMRKDDLVAMPYTRRVIELKGATFQNAYSTFPLCCPARASILTGQYAHNHGVLSNQSPTGGVLALNPRSTLATWLQPLGYTTAFIGKYLNRYGYVTEPTYVPRGWSAWHVPSRNTMRYRSFELNVNGRLEWFGRAYHTTVMGNRMADFIRRRAGAKPFVLVGGFLAPHSGGPLEPDDPAGNNRTPAVAAEYVDTEQDTELPPTEAYNEADISDKPLHIAELPELTSDDMDAHREINQQRLESIKSVDDQVRKIVRALLEKQQLRRTYIVVTSDNGYLLGEHRIPFGKVHPYEPSARVPMVMRGPGIPAGSQVEQLVGLHDLAPTVLRTARAAPPDTHPLDGRNLLPLVTDNRAGAGRDLVLEAGPMGELAADASFLRSSPAVRSYRGLRTNNGWKYIEYATGDVELYNLRADPDELNNLADDPAYDQRQLALEAGLDRLATCVGAGCLTNATPRR